MPRETLKGLREKIFKLKLENLALKIRSPSKLNIKIEKDKYILYRGALNYPEYDSIMEKKICEEFFQNEIERVTEKTFKKTRKTNEFNDNLKKDAGLVYFGEKGVIKIGEEEIEVNNGDVFLVKEKINIECSGTWIFISD